MTYVAQVLFPQIKDRPDEWPREFLERYCGRVGVAISSIRGVAANKNALMVEAKRAIREEMALTIFCGGTGLGPGNYVPQVLSEICDFEAVGIGECMRARGSRDTARAWLSRGGCWVKGTSIFLAVSGGSQVLQDQLGFLEDLLPNILNAASGACAARDAAEVRP